VLPIFPSFPRQVKWINGNTMSAEPWSRIKRHEAKGLGFRRLDDLPYVNTHRLVDYLQLIDQRNVYAAENILQQLGRFSSPARTHRNNLLDGPAIKLNGSLSAGRGKAPDDFRDSRYFAVGIARIFSFRREGQVKIHPRLKLRTFF